MGERLTHRSEELSAAMLWYAYGLGRYPMGYGGSNLYWKSPDPRTIFPISGIHVSRSLRKTIRKGVFEVRFDTSFRDVILACFRPRWNWLNEHFVRAYCDAFDEGWAHCCETWRDGRLVGGAYGLAVGSFFSAESMFHRETDASKVALWALVERCRELGFTIFDAQEMNPHLASLGAVDIPKLSFLRMLNVAVEKPTVWGVRR